MNLASDSRGARADKRQEKFLYIVWFDPDGLMTIRQTIEELIRFSSYSIDLLNLYPEVCMPGNTALDDYDGVIIHNTIAYNVDNLYLLDKACPTTLKDYTGLKILMKQDEHYRTDRIARYLGEIGIDLLLTICDKKKARDFYPSSVAPRTKFMRFLTGYVPEMFRALPYRATDNRGIDVGYRGSIQPMQFGRLAYEKKMIGADFLPYAHKRGLVTDISSRWEDRFLGTAWLDFLGNCKATLGMESGSDIVDYDGSVELKYNEYIQKHPKASDEEILELLAPHEGVKSYRAISPRHFEAAACRSVQVLFEGEYQGIFRPDIHYIPLKRDFSNVEEAIDKVMDEKLRRQMTDRAFEDIIANPRYTFAAFAAAFDGRLKHLLRAKRVSSALGGLKAWLKRTNLGRGGSVCLR
jgi:hypothetical protein